MSDSATLEDGRAVVDLKVVELREELQKRGLSKSGNKKELAERLRGFLVNGSGEVSDKSTPNSPVKSPVNSLVAQYRLTQQQLLKDAQKEPEPTEEKKDDTAEEENGKEAAVEENGHKDEQQQEDIPVKSEAEAKIEEPTPVKDEEPPVQEEKTQSPIPEVPSPVKEENSPPPKQTEPSPAKDEAKDEKSLEEQIPKAVSPIADREKSDTPEREVIIPPTEKLPIATESPKKTTTSSSYRI
jgi:hypothetical protein